MPGGILHVWRGWLINIRVLKEKILVNQPLADIKLYHNFSP
jgi:hypothetical protein